MRITFVTRKFGNVERNSHCDVLHIAPVRVANLVLDCNGVFAIKAYGADYDNFADGPTMRAHYEDFADLQCGQFNYDIGKTFAVGELLLCNNVLNVA